MFTVPRDGHCLNKLILLIKQGQLCPFLNRSSDEAKYEKRQTTKANGIESR